MRHALHGSLAFFLSVLASAGAALALPGSASAQTRTPATAIAPFAGRRAAPLERQVAAALGDDADLAPRARVRAAAGEAGVDGTGRSGVAELAAALDVELVVQGEVSGSRRRPQLELVVRGADGRELARGEAAQGRGRGGRGAFRDAVRALYDQARASLPAEAPPPLHGGASSGGGGASTSPSRVATASSGGGGGAEAQVPEDGTAVVTALAGLTLRSRDARVDLADGRQRRYESGVYPELGLALEVRPFANDSHLGRGLFFRGSFAHSVGLGSESADGTVQVDTNFLRFAVDAGWLAPLGDVVELGVALGVTYDGYFLSPNPVLPSAEYIAIRPAARARFRLVQETLVLDVELGYRGAVRNGAIRSAFGSDGDTHGLDIGASFGGNLHRALGLGFAWALRLDYVLGFLGLAGTANDTPGTGAEEASVRVSMMVGWSFL